MPPALKTIIIDNEALTFQQIEEKFGVTRELINKRTSKKNISQEQAVLMGVSMKQKLKKGQKIGHLTVIDHLLPLKTKNRKRNSNARYIFECECGNIVEKLGITVLKSPNPTCNKRGCHLGGKVFDNGTESELYQTWAGMKQRCYNKNNPSYNYYGGIGISVCDRWLNDFRAFEEDMGVRPKDFTLDRINPFGNYEPKNCKWSDKETQAKNIKRNFDLISHINYLEKLLIDNNIKFRKI